MHSLCNVIDVLTICVNYLFSLHIILFSGIAAIVAFFIVGRLSNNSLIVFCSLHISFVLKYIVVAIKLNLEITFTVAFCSVAICILAFSFCCLVRMIILFYIVVVTVIVL